MSPTLGKIEVIRLDDSYIYMRYHRALDPKDAGEFIVARRNDSGYWLDNFEIVSVADSGISGTSIESKTKAAGESRLKLLVHSH